MQQKCLTGILLGILLGTLILPKNVKAAPGTPNSLNFGYGARVNIDGTYVPLSLRMAAEMQLDWIALDFDWALTQPKAHIWNDNTSFNQALLLARSLGLDVLISIKRAPIWAMTTNGPDAQAVSVLVNTLANKYPGLLAVELFPGANTRAAWGTTPNPEAYAKMINVTENNLNSELYIISAGLTNQISENEDIRDVDFLQGMYMAGWKASILSIQLENLQDEPLEIAEQEHLRHYEEIRAVMSANQHSDGLLWVTSLGISNNSNDKTWLVQAYEQLQAQLYLGVVFYESFNPCGECQNSLLDKNGAPEREFFALQTAVSLRKDIPELKKVQEVADRLKQMAKN